MQEIVYDLSFTKIQETVYDLSFNKIQEIVYDLSFTKIQERLLRSFSNVFTLSVSL
jgi:hypothetical protein